jgi:hypothetical protein
MGERGKWKWSRTAAAKPGKGSWRSCPGPLWSLLRKKSLQDIPKAGKENAGSLLDFWPPSLAKKQKHAYVKILTKLLIPCALSKI